MTSVTGYLGNHAQADEPQADRSDEVVEFAVAVEERVLATLAELKPGRNLYTNVEY